MQGLPDKGFCTISDVTISATGNVGKAHSDCFCKYTFLSKNVSLLLACFMLCKLMFLPYIIADTEFCSVKAGVPIEDAEVELNELCPLSEYQTAPTHCA